MSAILFLILKSFTQWKTTQDREIYHKLLENQNILSREIAELKIAMEEQKKQLQQDFDRFREEVKFQSVEIQAPIAPKNEQNMLLNNRYIEIFELQKQGLSAEQIATKLDRGLGEVEFILQLAAQSNY